MQLGQTPLQNVGNYLADILIWWWLACGRRWRGWLALCLLIGLLIGWQVWARQDRQFYGPLQANLADRALLTGYALDQASYHPGEKLQLSLFWLGLSQTEHNDKVFVHLRDAGDTTAVAQHDGDPVGGYTPTSRWEPGELVVDEHTLTLPADLAPGRYKLVVGMYDPTTVQNIPMRAGTATLPGDRVLVTEVEVAP